MRNRIPLSFFALIGIVSLTLDGCSPSLKWVNEPTPLSPSCLPDRLLTWNDFAQRNRSTPTPAAQTAVRFLMNDSPPYLLAKFDPQHSWVRRNVANPSNAAAWRASEQLLSHERVHYLISCLLIRQANYVLRSEEDPMAMLELVKSVAHRINLQYDQDTNHGLDRQAQARWESEVQEQFEDVTLKQGNVVVNLSRD